MVKKRLQVVLIFILIISIVPIIIAIFDVPNVETFPVSILPNAETNISAEVRNSNYYIDTVNAEVIYPNNTVVNYDMILNFDFISESGIGAEPYNATALSYNIFIDCYDFTDNSECNVNASNIIGSCANVTFDDNETIGDPQEDLDIGILLCVNENAGYYNITFDRWDYEASNDVGVKYCINSTYGVNECSDWVLNSTSSNYNHSHSKTIYGGIYKKTFSDTLDSGRYNVTIYANDTNGNVNNTEKTFFMVYEMKNYTIEENKTGYVERWYNASLSDVIDDMDPEELDNLSQSKYETLENTTLYKKIVFFNNYTIDPNITAPLDYNINDTDKTRFVIKLNKTLDQNTYTFLKVHNITLFSRSGSSYLVRLNPLEITNLSNTSFLIGIWEIPIEGKLGKNLTNVNVTQNYNITISLFDDVNCSIAEQILSPYMTEEFKGNYTFNEACSDLSHYVIAEVNGSSINNTAKENIVEKIRLHNQKVNLTNYDAQLATGSDIIAQSYDGSGVRVAVVDTGIAYSGGSYHPDLPTPVWADEYLITESNVYDEMGHGTHVTGTIMGDGSRNSDYKGIAPGAELVVIRLCGQGPLFGWPEYCNDLSVIGNDPIEDAVNHDSDVISISIGDDSASNEYTGDSEILDDAVSGAYTDSGGNSAYPIIVTAVGNADQIVAAFATAKNVISVGAAKAGNDWAGYGEPAADDFYFSNYGPINPSGGSGNRIKPDVIAPADLISTFTWYDTSLCDDQGGGVGDSYYCTISGTSTATPVVSGIATSLLHHYPSFKVWPEATKAMIINSAVKLPTGTVPLSKQGHGHVNAFYSHYNHNGIYQTVVWGIGGITDGDPDDEWEFSVPSNFEEIKATLVYTDDSGVTTQQDLDLYIQDSDDVYRGVSISSADNVEETTIISGPSGTWKAKVQAYETTRETYYSVVVSIRLKDPDLDMSVSRSTDGLTAPETLFYITTDLKNYGSAIVGSYMELDVSDGFTLENVRVYRDDGTFISLDDSELYTIGNEFRVTVGETIYSHDRKVRWYLRNDASTPKGVYTFNIDYGAMNHDIREDSIQINVGLPDGYSCVEDSQCQSEYCDSDGIKLADDYWCFTPYNTYFDGQETSYCEFSTDHGDSDCDERQLGDHLNYCQGLNYYEEKCDSTCDETDITSRFECTESGCSCTEPLCDGLTTGSNINTCASGQTYFADKCTSTAGGEDRGDNICRSSTFASGCTADAECNGVGTGTSGCNSSCSYIPDNPPNTTLLSPVDNSVDGDGIVTFNCSATDDSNLVNITLYGNWSGGWHANETKSLTGTSDSATFTKSLSDGIYEWNCLAYDSENQNDWAGVNWIINISIIPNDTHKFSHKNSSGSIVAWLGNLGNIVLKGNCYSGGSCDNPGPNSFIIRNSTNANVAFINSTGDMCIVTGDCSDQSATCNPTRDAFIMRNSSNYNMSYIDFDGDLCLTGKLYENSEL